jgi:hypothetical protein
MFAGCLGVVQADAAGRVAADAVDGLRQVELLALVGTLDEDHSRHGSLRLKRETALATEVTEKKILAAFFSCVLCDLCG